MSSHRSSSYRIAIAGATCCSAALFVAVAPPAASAPAYDSQGYVDSTARCSEPASMVVFGSTATSRVAICVDADGAYQYRGVRVRDGARLIAPASQSSDGAFTAVRDGVEYMVSSDALVVSMGEKVIRDEEMVDFHRAGTAGTQTESDSTSAPTTTPTSTPAPSSRTATPSTPLPPPLPAEVGGGGGEEG